MVSLQMLQSRPAWRLLNRFFFGDEILLSYLTTHGDKNSLCDFGARRGRWHDEEWFQRFDGTGTQ